MDVYFAFSDRMSVDKSSYKFDYAKERMIIDCLWQHADHGKNRNVTILLLHGQIKLPSNFSPLLPACEFACASIFAI